MLEVIQVECHLLNDSKGVAKWIRCQERHTVCRWRNWINGVLIAREVCHEGRLEIQWVSRRWIILILCLNFFNRLNLLVTVIVVIFWCLGRLCSGVLFILGYDRDDGWLLIFFFMDGLGAGYHILLDNHLLLSLLVSVNVFCRFWEAFQYNRVLCDLHRIFVLFFVIFFYNLFLIWRSSYVIRSLNLTGVPIGLHNLLGRRVLDS